MGKKYYFTAVKKINPRDMEYFLEEQASEGYMLETVGELGLFYFNFIETAPQKCKYVVDISSLPKNLYMGTLVDDGWEYMGKTANCYIWRKVYEDQRPKDFADKVCLRKHCLRMGTAFLIASIICVLAFLGFIYGISLENKMGVRIHTVAYCVEAAFIIPFVLLFSYISKKLFNGLKMYK